MEYYRIIIFIGIILLSSCREKPSEEKAQDPVNVKIAVVQKEVLSLPVRAPGTISSKTQSNLSFLTGGIIREIRKDEGEMVKKGELLARLDLTEINSRLEQARLAYDKAKRDFQRVENLYNDSVVTLEQYQNAQTAVNLAESNYQIARFNKRYSEIHAPGDGKILKRLAEVNEVTGQGRPVFVFASTEADWVMHLNFSDHDFVKISANDSASISFDAWPGIYFPAVVSELASAADLMTGTYEVELTLLETPERLVSGLVGKAKIFPPKEEVLIIPPEALREAGGNTANVFILRNGKPIRRKIQIRDINDNGIFVQEGLAAGDTLITEGNAYVREGEELKIKE